MTIRPCPPEFREVYLDIGWDGIIEHFRCNTRCISRWVDESVGDELRAARAEVVKARGKQIRTCIGSYDTTDSRWYDRRSARIPK